MGVIQTGTNIATVKLSELPKSMETQGRVTLATNKETNLSEALELTAVAEATDKANQAAQTALNAAQTAKQAAQNANTARKNNAYELSQKTSQFTGAIMGEGIFQKADAPSWWPEGDCTVRIVFRTGADVKTPQGIFYAKNSNYALRIRIVSDGFISLYFNGSSGYYACKPQPNTLYEAILVNTATDCYGWLNTKKTTISKRADTYLQPSTFSIGSADEDYDIFTGTVIAAQLFNFAFSDEDAAASWNGGHPESWCVPDGWRNIISATWPTGTYQPAKSTWYKSSGNVNQTDNVPAANGFSGEFQRFISSTSAAYTAAFNQYSASSIGNDQVLLIQFEYRSEGPVRLYDDMSGYGGFKTLPANTGNAQKACVLTRAGLTCSIRTDPQKTLEIRTLSIQPAGAILDLTPASLTHTVWRDRSGKGNDIPFKGFYSETAESTPSYEKMGYPDTIVGTAAPTVAPDFIGQSFIDTTHRTCYKAVGMTAATDWEQQEDKVALAALADTLAEKSAPFTGAIMNKGRFTSTDKALLTKDKPFTVIACFVVPDTSEGSRMIAHDGYGTHDVSSYYITGYTKAYGVRANIRGVSVQSGNQPLPIGALAQVAVSYIPDGTLTVCFNDRVIVNESPAYTREANPKETSLGGYDYEPFNAQTTIISFRKFDFAMTADQLVEAWNEGHPESWRVPAVYRNGTEGARCILDLIPESLTSTVWRDTSGQGHDLTYKPYGDNPSECEMDYVHYETLETEYKQSPLYGQQTAALVGGYAGYFKSERPALILPDQPTTLIVCFKLPSSGTALVYDVNTTSANVTPFGEYIYAQNGNFVRVSMRGGSGFSKSLVNTKLCMAAISYAPNKPLIVRINEYVEESDGVPTYTNPYTPQHVRLGGWSSSYEKLQIISVRRFDFAMTKEQLEEAWNGGHPERWKVPDVYRNVVPSQWRIDYNTEQLATWGRNQGDIKVTYNLSAANGFSGVFTRYEPGEEQHRISIYNGWRNSHKQELGRYQLIEFEYRTDAETLKASTSLEVYAEFPKNTGDAKVVSYIAPAGKYSSVGADTGDGTFLEIRTLRVVTLSCILDLSPQGALPTKWLDASGKKNDLHFHRMTVTNNSPETCQLSYENHGFLDTIIGDKAPDIYPQFTGQEYIDRTNETMYKAVGTSAVSKWKPL